MNVSALEKRIGRLYRLKNAKGMDWDYIVQGVQLDFATGKDIELEDFDPWSDRDESFLDEEVMRVESGLELFYLDVSQRALRIYNIEHYFLTGSYEKDHYAPYSDTSSWWPRRSATPRRAC